MTKREIVLARGALRALDSAGASGLSFEALKEQAGTFSESIVSRMEAMWLEKVLLEREWAKRWQDPVTENMRFVLTDCGHLAMGAL